MNKTRLIVTRVFDDSRRTPQDAFVRAILNSDRASFKGLKKRWTYKLPKIFIAKAAETS